MWEFNHKESWALKNWCFSTVVLERLLRVPWAARWSNPSILKEIHPEYSLEGLKLKLKVCNFGHLMWRADSLEKTLMLGKIEGNRGWDVWMASLTQWTWVWVSSGSWWWTGKPGVLQFMRTQRVGHDWASELNWTGVRNKDLVRRWKKEKTQEKNAVNPGAKQLWTVLVHLHVGFIFQY